MRTNYRTNDVATKIIDIVKGGNIAKYVVGGYNDNVDASNKVFTVGLDAKHGGAALTRWELWLDARNVVVYIGKESPLVEHVEDCGVLKYADTTWKYSAVEYRLKMPLSVAITFLCDMSARADCSVEEYVKIFDFSDAKDACKDTAESVQIA